MFSELNMVYCCAYTYIFCVRMLYMHACRECRLILFYISRFCFQIFLCKPGVRRTIVVNGAQRGVCGGSFDIQISWLYLLVQQVLRALPAETKVDGLPRASSFRWLFDHIPGFTNSFGFSSFVNLDMVSLLPWVAAGSSRKSI